MCWCNHSGNIWCGTHILLLWGFQILVGIVYLYIKFNDCLPLSSLLYGLTMLPLQSSLISGSNKLSGILSTSPSAGWCSIMCIQCTCSTEIGSWGVHCGHIWLQSWAFQYWICWYTIRLNVWPGCFHNFFGTWKQSYGCCLIVVSVRFLLDFIYVLTSLPHFQNIVDFAHFGQCSKLHLLF
jgi:hypothetical protein